MEQAEQNLSKSGEFQVKLPASVLSTHSDIEDRVDARVQALIAEGHFTEENIRFIKALTLPAASGGLAVSDELLERLRRAAQIWDVSLKQRPITSHRKFIGPVIVGVKKLIFPVISFFLADTLRQQRDFNAAVLRCLVELARKDGRASSDEEASA
jgi:hypothetical protein